MQRSPELEQPLVNRVAQSALKVIDLEELYPQGEQLSIDLADQLYQGLILREKDFRTWLAEHDWNQYAGKPVAIYCSADAIVPVWAYMLVSARLSQVHAQVFSGTPEEMLAKQYDEILQAMELEEYAGAKVVIKGCSNKAVPRSAYVRLTSRLQPLVASIMYGEPCSTVPIYKKPKG